MGATINFIGIFLKLLDENYGHIRVTYSKAMKDMYKQITKTTTKKVSPRQKVQKLMTEIGGEWYMEKSTKGLPPLRRPKLSKKAQEKEYKILKTI